MPTNKTPFTFNIKDEYLEKMQYIEKHEHEHGKIEVENTEKAD
mgnify:CR=1 FL=1